MNKMIRKMALLLVMVTVALGMNANPVDMRTVREVAVKFVNANAKTPLRSADNLQLVTTYSNDRGDAAFHIFNTSNGFVIVSADDCASPILGYSNEGQFDTANVPIQLQDYLQDFVKQIGYGIEHRLTADEVVAEQWNSVKTYGTLYGPRATADAVEPLLTSTWNQECYYNNLCPRGYGPCGHVLTGCIPTAMGQIMRYWGYPTVGTGSVTYKPDSYPQQSVNFVEAVYDYDNMPDYLDNLSDSIQVNAVATLLWHCGVAVHADYGTTGTYSYDFLVSAALKNYFLYSSDMYGQDKDDVGNEVWLEQVKACLDLSRPLYYSGGGGAMNVAGHAFVCDGYDSNDLLHFNWGWGGVDDGYFALNALHTSNGYYSTNQYALFDIHPACNGEMYQVSSPCSPSNGGTVTGAGTYECGSVCTLTATPNEGYRFYYWSRNGEEISYDAIYSFAVSEDIELEANFGIAINVTATANPGEGGTVTGGGVYDYNNTCILTAIPNEGYVFNNWTKNGEVISCLSTYSFNVTEDVGYVANFLQTDGIIVGDAGSISFYLPTYGHKYALSQQIYTAEEMGSEAYEISCVSFFNTSYEITRDLTIYMVNTNKSSFGSNTDWITVTEADQVFSGVVAIGNRSWATIYFDTPFNYDGSSNVALIVDDNSNAINTMRGRAFGTNDTQAIYVVGGSDYDPYNPTFSGTRLTEKNQVIFGHPKYKYEITAQTFPVEGGYVSGADSCYYGEALLLTATANEGYVFTKWTQGGTVVSYLSSINVSATGNAVYRANFEAIPNSIAIGEGTSTSSYLPTCSIYKYSMSQQIFTAEEMNTDACDIAGVSLFNFGQNKTRNLSIYMAHTDKDSFENGNDWVAVTAEDMVYSGYVPMNAGVWSTVNFNTVFSYNGTSNVILVVCDNSGNQGWDLFELRFKTFKSNSNQTIRICGSNSAFDPYNPSSYSGSISTEKNHVVFRLISTVSATSDPEYAGAVSGAGEYRFGQTCTLTATPAEGYCFMNWTCDGEIISSANPYSFAVYNDIELVAHFIRGTTIGDGGTSTSSYLPSHSNYNNSLTQQIYTADEIGMSGTITSIAFYNSGTQKTRTYDFYLKNTEKTSFTNGTDWITVADGDKVFSGDVTMTANGWTFITFDTPFLYDGVSNLVLVADDNTGSYSSGLSCRVFNAPSQAIRIYGSDTNFDPCSPSEYYGAVLNVKNQIKLGITPLAVQQSIALTTGVNWVSFNVETTLDGLKAALAATGGTNIVIKAKSSSTTWNGQRWLGTLNGFDVNQMYQIKLNSACEITLEGIPLVPAEHPVIISNGVNWIGFPLNEGMTLTEAFAGFPANQDVVKSKTSSATWNGQRWVGQLTTLEPGQGYIYQSKATENKTFVFPQSTE